MSALKHHLESPEFEEFTSALPGRCDDLPRPANGIFIYKDIAGDEHLSGLSLDDVKAIIADAHARKSSVKEVLAELLSELKAQMVLE